MASRLGSPPTAGSTAGPTPRLMVAQALLFLGASALHRGYLTDGYQHVAAARAEAVIAVVLLAGAAVAVRRGRWGWVAGFAAQVFALAGVGVGVVMIAIGIGPQTPVDFVLHAAMACALGAGLWLVFANRRRT